jgi:cell division protein FtsN
MRDYSTQASRHRRTEKKVPSAAVGVTLSIVLLGVVLVILIWLNQRTRDIEPTDTPQPALSEPTNQTPSTNTSTTTEKAITIEQEIPEAPENFYTFYKLLISGEVPIDLNEGNASDEAVAEKLKSTIIQVASFRTAEAAENARVTLLFLDLKARVIPPSQSDGGWHRLILGPFKPIRDMQSTIDTLTKNGYNALERKE